MFCPKCNTEYREGFTKCSDCNVELVEKLYGMIPNTEKFVSAYETTRKIMMIISACGWVLIFISVLIFVVKSLSIIYLLTGLLVGFSFIISGQITRAVVDTADNTGEMLYLMKKRNGRME